MSSSVLIFVFPNGIQKFNYKSLFCGYSGMSLHEKQDISNTQKWNIPLNIILQNTFLFSTLTRTENQINLLGGTRALL